MPALPLDDLSKGISTFDFSQTSERCAYSYLGLFPWLMICACSSMDTAFHSCPNTSGHIYLLKAVGNCLDGQPENQLLSSWRQSRVEETLKDLRKPTDEDVDWVVSSAISIGGPTQLENLYVYTAVHVGTTLRDGPRIVPQLLVECDSGSLIAFARRIHSLADDELHPDGRNETVSLLMTSAVSKANFLRFIKQPPSLTHRFKPLPHHLENLAAAKHCLRACVDLDCLDLLPRMFSKVAEIKDLRPEDAKDHVQVVMIHLLTYGHPLLGQNSETFWQKCVHEIAKVAAPLYLECVAGRCATEAEIHTLIQVALWGEKELIATQ